MTDLWSKYIGLHGRSVGIDRFGISGSAPEVYKALGMTTEAVVQAVKAI